MTWLDLDSNLTTIKENSMDEKLIKSLTSLIDETISEIEDLKKSRFAASEVKIEGPGDGLAGQPSNGSIGKEEKDKDDDDDDDDDDEAKKEEVEKGVLDEAEKADMEKGINEEAAKSEEAAKEETEKEETEKEEAAKEEAEKEEAEKACKKSEDEAEDLKKSLDERDELLKSQFNDAISGLEKKIAGLMEVVEKMADQPVAKKGIDGIVPLKKSEEVEPLSKSEVASKLFELKKSGKEVDTLDISTAETGGDLQAIIEKYNLKGDK